MVSAEFYGTDFSQLKVRFNETLNRTVDYNSCSQIFNASETLRKFLGNSAICQQLSDNSILVTPATYGIVRNHYILKPNKANFVPIDITVTPVSMPVPALTISGFTELCGACNSTTGMNESLISFNLDKSTGLGYGTLHDVTWNITWIDFLPLPPVTSQPVIVVPSSSSVPMMQIMSSTESWDVGTSSPSSLPIIDNVMTPLSQQMPSLMTSTSASSAAAMMSGGNDSDSSSSVVGLDDAMMTSFIAEESDPSSAAILDSSVSSSILDMADLSSSQIDGEAISSSSAVLSDDIAPTSTTSYPAEMVASSSIVDTTTTITTTTTTTTTTTPATTTTSAPRVAPSFNYTSYLNKYQNSPIINLPLSIFNRSNVYQLHVRAKNAFGNEATAVVNISFDFTCGGVAKLRRVAHAQILYEITVAYPPCFGEYLTRTYEWSLESSNSLTIEGNVMCF